MFVVRLRDDDGRVMPGVHIEDNGLKMGLNGAQPPVLPCARQRSALACRSEVAASVPKNRGAMHADMRCGVRPPECYT